MSAKSNELVNELVSACIAFGRGVAPDWQTRIETAQRELREYIAELEAEIDQLAAHDAIERQDAEERAHLEKLVSSLKARIAGLEAANDALLKDNDMLFRASVAGKSPNSIQSAKIVYRKEREE